MKLTKLSKCAGCGAKVGAGTLAALLGGMEFERDENLLVGYDKSDDASVYRVSDELAIVQTVDFFPPIADDPFTYGRIAAANAISDIYAMGAEPKLAQNVMCVPEDMAPATVREILRGGADAAREAGAIITGGHSILDDVPKYGMCVTGFVHPDKILTNSGARPGDILFLTKPIGAGAITTAMKAELASEESAKAAIASMSMLNKYAKEACAGLLVHAATDVTGFGLMGHALEMAEGSGVTIGINSALVPLLPGAMELAAMGLLPAGMYRNREFAEASAKIAPLPLALIDLLFDPETSGGLLIAIDPRDAARLEARLNGAVPMARRIGEVLEKGEKGVLVR